MCYAESEDALSRQMHAFAAEHVVRGKWKKRERPVLVNSWEGAYFDFNADSVVEMAKVSKELGAELFVLDARLVRQAERRYVFARRLVGSTSKNSAARSRNLPNACAAAV